MKEAPLAQISKTAEKKQDMPVLAESKRAEKLPEKALLPSTEKIEQKMKMIMTMPNPRFLRRSQW